MKYYKYFIVAAFFYLIPFVVFSQSAGDFRSFQTGNWSSVDTWERYDGSVWITPVPNVPTATDGIITILDGHTITLDADTTVDQVTVNATGTLLVAASKRLTIANGADSVDLMVYGTLNQFGTITVFKVLPDSARISIENGGSLIYSVPLGADIAMPNYSWRTGSTCRIDSTTGTTPTNLRNQTLYNLIWNGTTSGANGGPNFNDATIIYGDLTLLSSKSLQWRVTNLSGGQTKNIYIRGSVYVNGFTALLTSTGSGADTLAKAIINVDGNINLYSGRWSLCNSGAAYAEWKVKGNVNITGGSVTSGASGWAFRRTLNFCGGTTQSFTVSDSGTIGTAPTNYKVSNGSTVQLNFPFTLSSGSALTLESGTFETSSTNVLTLPATGSIVGGSSASYINGPLAVVVATTNLTTRTFPIGKNTIYRPVILSVNQDASTATTYTAELFNEAPPTRTLPPILLGVSPVRYYSITKGTGANLSSTLGATVQLMYDVDDQIKSAIETRVAKDNGAGAWVSLGGNGTADTTGTITSNAFFTFSDFVLATADTNIAADPPVVSTTAVTYISTTFATSGGNVTNDGGGAVTGRGVCWNTTGSPTIADDKTTDSRGAGVFTSYLIGLTPGLTYYLRAYATNSAGTAYGSELTFMTYSTIIPPVVSTTPVTNIQVTTAISGGNVTEWGGDSVTMRGICWNTTGSPTVSGKHSLDGSGMGSFASGMALLTGGTTYYVRAYAVNSAGTGYGDELMFSTQIPQADTTVIVAQDGSGNYLTVQEAFRAVPTNYTGKWTIFVKKGVYYEKDTLTSGKINVYLIGEDRDSTIITYNDYADSHGSGVPGTSGSFTIAIDASDFTAKNITFQNTYSPQPGVSGSQAVALRTQGDRHEYINCRILGYQDTYYTWGGNGTGRMYHRNCIIEGTVDFIFGRNIVVFDSCTIHEIRNSATMTAGSTDAGSKYGYVFRNCTIVVDSIGYDGTPITYFYLGRPWQGSPRTVFINSYEPSTLIPAGWLAWNVTPGLYAEFNCFGPGSSTAGRVPWSSQLAALTASEYSLSTIFSKNSAVSSLILYDWMPVNAMSDLPLIFRVTSSAGANGSITPDGISNVAYGSNPGYKLTPEPGYYVDSLFIDETPVMPDTIYTFNNVTANRTIRATFAVSTNVTITASAGLNGTINPVGDVPVLQGSDQVFSISPDAGYHIDSLFADGVPISPMTSYTFHYITVPHTIRAVFALTKTFTLTISALHGSVAKNPDRAVYDTATVVQLTANANYGYNFTGWSGDTVTTANPIYLTMNSDKVLTANFVLDSVTVPVNVNAKWNMVSIPVTRSEMQKTVLFPTASTAAFEYQGSYVQRDTLESKKGYWLKFPAEETIPLSGVKRVLDTMVLVSGWNIIGSISDPVDVGNITQVPGDNIISFYYGYSGSYQQTDTIVPGKAYFVKASTNGSLVLESGSAQQAKKLPENIHSAKKQLEGFSTITIADAEGRQQTLYIGAEKETGFPLALYELPPSAPAGEFDVRFTSQRMVEVYGKNHPASFPIQLNSVAYPVVVSWNITSNDGAFQFDDGLSDVRTISGKGKLSISKAEVNEITISVSSQGIPEGFSLLQNYPNPFNPETNIKFSVEASAPTTLTVCNILGQKIAALFDDIAEPGQYYTVIFHAENVAGGVYYYRLQSGTKTEIKSMMLVK